MTKAQHTPQWRWEEDGRGVITRLVDENNFPIIAPEEYAGTAWLEVAEGKKSLITAAPELLAACEQAKKYLETDLVEPGRSVFWNLVAAIAKATGKAA
jgi:hypothetical protein